MSGAVAAVLRKIASGLLSKRKGLKTAGGIFLGILILIFMPIFALLAIFETGLSVDTNRLQHIVLENISQEQKEKYQHVQNTMTDIATKMQEAGFAGTRVTEAQILFSLALYDKSYEPDFISTLVGCFSEGQTDSQLVSAVNSTFGVSINTMDFTNMMGSVRAVYIDISDYTDPTTKNNLDIVQWAIQAEKRGWGYVWGTFGDIFDEDMYNYKMEQYPDEVGGYADFIKENWLGGRTADCVGLIKGYGWLNVDTMKVEYGTNGMPDVGSDGMYRNATEKGPINTIPEIPGLAVWKAGHIGIYIGDGKVIEAKGTHYGVVESELANATWTHWLKIPYITYVEQTEEETQPSTEPSTVPTTNGG